MKSACRVPWKNFKSSLEGMLQPQHCLMLQTVRLLKSICKCTCFGGVDIVVNNAGISISKPVADHSIEDWDKLYDILVKGQFLVSKLGVEVMRKTRVWRRHRNIVSKNSVVSGPNNAGYGSAKAAQAHCHVCSLRSLDLTRYA